jgi:hypothetical protein
VASVDGPAFRFVPLRSALGIDEPAELCEELLIGGVRARRSG